MRSRLASGSALPLAAAGLFILLIAASAWIAVTLGRQAGLIQRNEVVANSLSDLLYSLQEAESGQRGYLITEDDAYLARYDAARKTIADAFTKLDEATADNSTQHEMLSELSTLATARLGVLKEGIERRRAGDETASLGSVRSRRGQALMDQTHAILSRMRTEQVRILVLQRASNAFSSRALLGVTTGSGILAILFTGLWLRGARRHAEVLERARDDLRAANTGLETKVAERTAELRDSNQEIQRFAYIVSHDLRAPLVNIMGFTSEIDAARDDIRTELPDTAKARMIDIELAEALGFIKAAISKMDGLIAAILKISRDGRRAFRPERLNVTALVCGLADAQRHQTEEVGAVVHINPLPAITADRLAVEQIFGNLIDNAVKYLVPGRAGRIEVSGTAVGSQLRYQVEDNGRGIAAADQERVFELFRRAGTQDRPGDGIGLAHVQTLVRSMGGRIDLTSEPAVGTIFRVTLPRTPPVA